jgi:ATP-dependent exoDNAse (exonuclease V) beta subunit
LPLYDLANEIYCIYKVFDHFKEEEATLVKILEVIKNFEGEGRNNPGDFLKYASEEEAGESDWTINVPAGINAVKVMTIHKAKGLESPVAIVLIYEESSRGFKYIIDEKADGVRLLRINQQIMKASPFLQEKYEEERLKDLVNKLNTLYVGFTRAEDELYIVGVGSARNQFPIDLLKEMGSQTGWKRAPRPRSPEMTQERMDLEHPPDPIKLPFGAVEELNLEERRRGEFIHRVLSLIEGLDEDAESELDRFIKRVNDELKTDYQPEAMKQSLLEFLNHDEVSPYFRAIPGRIVKKEQEFSDSRGNLFRMDRVIFEEDQISVIDYKTGTDKEAEKEYVYQLKNYIRILKEIYPGKKVEGIIAYVDLKEIIRVK